jgi:hypothetical protein
MSVYFPKNLLTLLRSAGNRPAGNKSLKFFMIDCLPDNRIVSLFNSQLGYLLSGLARSWVKVVNALFSLGIKGKFIVPKGGLKWTKVKKGPGLKSRYPFWDWLFSLSTTYISGF